MELIATVIQIIGCLLLVATAMYYKLKHVDSAESARYYKADRDYYKQHWHAAENSLTQILGVAKWQQAQLASPLQRKMQRAYRAQLKRNYRRTKKVSMHTPIARLKEAINQRHWAESFVNYKGYKPDGYAKSDFVNRHRQIIQQMKLARKTK